MKEQIIKKPTIYDYPSTDERTFVELDGKVNWEKYAKALDEFIVKLADCKCYHSNDKLDKIDKRGGWICPRCQKLHSWLSMTCDCPPNVITASTTESKEVTEIKDQIIEILKRFRIKSLEEDGTISISQLIYQSDFDKVAEEIEKLYQQEYLNSCIERATPGLSKIKDVDKELAEIKGEDHKCENCNWFKIGYGHCNFCLQSKWMHNNWEPIKTE